MVGGGGGDCDDLTHYFIWNILNVTTYMKVSNEATFSLDFSHVSQLTTLFGKVIQSDSTLTVEYLLHFHLLDCFLSYLS
jgi:hypothetical protein